MSKYKDYVILAVGIILCVIILVLAIWAWWFADCQTLKALNFNAPGRCIS